MADWQLIAAQGPLHQVRATVRASRCEHQARTEPGCQRIWRPSVISELSCILVHRENRHSYFNGMDDGKLLGPAAPSEPAEEICRSTKVPNCEVLMSDQMWAYLQENVLLAQICALQFVEQQLETMFTTVPQSAGTSLLRLLFSRAINKRA